MARPGSHPQDGKVAASHSGRIRGQLYDSRPDGRAIVSIRRIHFAVKIFHHFGHVYAAQTDEQRGTVQNDLKPCSNASIPSTGELGALLNEVLTEATSGLSVSVEGEEEEDEEDKVPGDKVPEDKASEVKASEEPCAPPATSSSVVGLDAILHPCPGRILFIINFQMHINQTRPQPCAVSGSRDWLSHPIPRLAGIASLAAQSPSNYARATNMACGLSLRSSPHWPVMPSPPSLASCSLASISGSIHKCPK